MSANTIANFEPLVCSIIVAGFFLRFVRGVMRRADTATRAAGNTIAFSMLFIMTVFTFATLYSFGHQVHVLVAAGQQGDQDRVFDVAFATGFWSTLAAWVVLFVVQFLAKRGSEIAASYKVEVIADSSGHLASIGKKAARLLELQSPSRDLLMFGPESARQQCPSGIRYYAIKDIFTMMDTKPEGAGSAAGCFRLPRVSIVHPSDSPGP